MEQQNRSRMKIVIIVLAALLAVSVVALVGVLVINRLSRPVSSTVDVPGNIITPDAQDSTPDQSDASGSIDDGSGNAGGENRPVDITGALSLHNRRPEDNTPFEAVNLFPGDAETRAYALRVYHKGNVTLRFHADIRPGYEKLAEVLKVRVQLQGETEPLYDGLMRDMPPSLNRPLQAAGNTRSDLCYEITAYLETSVGNDYQEQTLVADFRWWVEETENLTSPQTGDSTRVVCGIVLAVAAVCILVLLIVRRRKGTEHDED